MSASTAARSLQDRITTAAQGPALRHLDTLSRSPLYAPAVTALLETEMALSEQRRAGDRLLRSLTGRRSTYQRRVDQERADRVALDASRASLRRPPAVWWHESGTGAPIMLVNGWTASGLLWPSHLVRALDRTHRVIRVDNRGTGYARTAPSPYTIATMADDVADVLKASTNGPAVVVGLSMGGMIAQEVALRHPKLVTALVLVGTRPPAPVHIPASPDVLGRALDRPGPDEPKDAFVASVWTSFCAPGFGERRPDLVAELVGQVLARATPQVAVNTQLRAIAAWHGPERLRKLALPTVVVHGTADRLMPVGNGMRLAQLIPGATYVELPDVGHLVPMEASETLADVVLGLA